MRHDVYKIIRFRSQYLPAIHNSIAIFSTLNYVHCSRRRHGCYGNEINVTHRWVGRGSTSRYNIDTPYLFVWITFLQDPCFLQLR